MISKIKKSAFVKLSSVVFLGNLLSQVIIFIAFAIFARLFPMSEIGIYTIFISLSILLAIPATGRYELAIMLPKIKLEIQAVLAIALSLALIFAILLSFIFLIFPFYEYSTKLASLRSQIQLLPFGVFLMAAFVSFQLYFNKLEKFQLNAWLKVLQAISMLVLSILLAKIFSYSSFVLMLAWILSQFLVFLIYSIIYISSLELFTLQQFKALMKRYKKYPTISMLGNFVNTFSIELPNYFIPLFYGANTQTLYAYGARVAAMPRNLIGSAVGDVFYAQSSKVYHENPSALIHLLKKVSVSLFIFSIGIYLVGILTASIIFPLIFGHEYAQVVPYFQWIAFASIFLLIQSPISTISDVLQELKAPLIFNISSLLIKLSVFVFGGLYLENPIHLIALYALVTALLSLFWIYYLHLITYKLS